MDASVHGHDVMRMMIESQTEHGYTRESLRSAMFEKFGADARYHTCVAENMDADTLIDYLAARGKFVEAKEGFNTAEEKICNH